MSEMAGHSTRSTGDVWETCLYSSQLTAELTRDVPVPDSKCAIRPEPEPDSTKVASQA